MATGKLPWSDANWSCSNTCLVLLWYYLYLYVQLIWNEMTCGGLPFRAPTGCPIPDVGVNYPTNVLLMSLHLSTPLWCFRQLTLFLNKGLGNFLLTSSISDSHTILWTFCKSVLPDVATDSPCGARSLGWTTCLLYVVPFIFSKCPLLCKFGIVERSFLVISCLY